ncbi:hypothetical protein MNBD_GAMMA05-578 [hydrothermal vent metagenome]|uniref:Uncharacterized protein n=1 Tax=hydrothermal vent metagenome TaxID=652676 RepID=A0A3B0WA75_9ZZZZ
MRLAFFITRNKAIQQKAKALVLQNTEVGVNMSSP